LDMNSRKGASANLVGGPADGGRVC
jgi:hypothetical protein